MHHNRLWMLSLTTIVFLAACSQPVTAPVVESLDPTLPSPAVASTLPSLDSQPTSLPPANSPEPPAATAIQRTLPPTVAADTPTPVGLAFVKMEVPVTGVATLDITANIIRLSPDFTVDPGPDLYVILSGANNLSLDFQSFSRTVIDTPILYLSALASTSGEQTYTIPAGTGLAQFNTVVVWCKTYSVAFAAAPLR